MIKEKINWYYIFGPGTSFLLAMILCSFIPSLTYFVVIGYLIDIINTYLNTGARTNSKPISIKNKFIPFGSYSALMFFGIIFYKNEKLSKNQILHEQIHIAQMLELGCMMFYLLYVFEYIVLVFKLKSTVLAYSQNSFERDAYNNQNNSDYLLTRQSYGWLKNYCSGK